MARDHYIPASLISRFSYEDGFYLRDRSVYVARVHGTRVFQLKAAKLGYEDNLYDLHGSVSYLGDASTVDGVITGYEENLPGELEKLRNAEPINAYDWLRTLVPFVAAIFVRGKDFASRYESRIDNKELLDLLSVDNTNLVRGLELTRLLAPIMCARWVVLHHNGPDPLMLSNLGVLPTKDRLRGSIGYAVPIDPWTTLGVFPRETRTVAQYQNGAWNAVIEHRAPLPQDTATYNEALAKNATEWIAGPTRDLVAKYLGMVGTHVYDLRLAMEYWPVGSKARRFYELDWFRAVLLLNGNPSLEDVANTPISRDLPVADGWLPILPMIIDLKKPRPSGLSVSGRSIRLKLTLPDDYDSYFGAPDQAASE